MKKFFKFVGFSLLGLIALVVAVGMFAGGETETSNTTVTKGGTDSNKVEDKEVEQANIGDTLKVGDVEFKVSGKSEGTNVGGEYGQNAKGKYLILDVSVANKGDKALLVDSSLFKLKVDGKEYEADDTAGIYANQEADFFLSEINPDITIQGKVVFDVPAELLQKELTLNVQTGIFGTEQGQISLK